MKIVRLGHKVYKAIMTSLADNDIFSTNGTAKGLGYSSSSRILGYLESMKRLGYVEEFYEIISNAKHNCVHRSNHYFVQSDIVNKAYEARREWIEKGILTSDRVDVKKYIPGRLLHDMICKECKTEISVIKFLNSDIDVYNKYVTSNNRILTNRGRSDKSRPIRAWRLTVEGIFYVIILMRSKKDIKKLIRKYSERNEILKLAALLHVEDLAMLIERLRIAKQFRQSLTTEAYGWYYAVNIYTSNYNNRIRNELTKMLLERKAAEERRKREAIRRPNMRRVIIPRDHGIRDRSTIF